MGGCGSHSVFTSMAHYKYVLNIFIIDNTHFKLLQLPLKSMLLIRLWLVPAGGGLCWGKLFVGIPNALAGGMSSRKNSGTDSIAGLLLYTAQGFRCKFSIPLSGDISAGRGVSVGLSQNLVPLRGYPRVCLHYNETPSAGSETPQSPGSSPNSCTAI